MHHHPFGNAYFPTPECGGAPYNVPSRHCFEKRCAGLSSPPADCFVANMSQIVVQHGSREYQFNRIQACAQDFTVLKGEAWYTRYWPFVACVEDHYEEGIGCAGKCAQAANFTSAETRTLHECFGTPSGDSSVIREAKATVDHAGTPTVIVDGKMSSPQAALADVCAAWKGPKPPGCHRITVDVETVVAAEACS